MRSIFLIILFCFNIIASDKLLQSDDPRIFLNNISKYAIKMGSGDSKEVYIFVDPMCKYSKRLLHKINESDQLRSLNTYYIFLYKLNKFDSEELINYIYQSDDPKSTLIEIMVDEEIADLDEFDATSDTLKDIKKVSDVAKRLDMKLRPYVISFEKGSKFCMVSEGTAPCLDEFDK